MPRCSQRRRDGKPCRAYAVNGTGRCPAHPEVARRPRLTPEVAELLLSALRAGAYVEIACEAAGIARRTFYEWWRGGDPTGDDPALADLRRFREQVEQAKAQAEIRQVALIANAAQTNWQAAAWLLERRYPDRWARASQREKGDAPAPEASAPVDPFAEIDELAERRRVRP